MTNVTAASIAYIATQVRAPPRSSFLWTQLCVSLGSFCPQFLCSFFQDRLNHRLRTLLQQSSRTSGGRRWAAGSSKPVNMVESVGILLFAESDWKLLIQIEQPNFSELLFGATSPSKKQCPGEDSGKARTPEGCTTAEWAENRLVDPTAMPCCIM